MLPGLLVGFFNQASPNTLSHYKLNYGFSIPIAFWSYKSKINAAKKGIEIAEAQLHLLNKKLYSDNIQALLTYQQCAEIFLILKQ